MTRLTKILCPTDFSEHSEHALAYAATLAKEYDATLLVLHVDTPLSPAAYGMAFEGLPPPSVLTDDLREARHRLMEDLRRVRPPISNLKIEHHLMEGAPAEAILEFARRSGCDLIVMGTHGRTGVRRAVVGSVAEQVVRKAPCPVLTIKLPAAAGTGEQSEPAGVAQVMAAKASTAEGSLGGVAEAHASLNPASVRASPPPPHAFLGSQLAGPAGLADRVAAIPLFDALTVAERRELLDAMIDETYEPGQDILRAEGFDAASDEAEGTCRSLFVMLAGEAEVLIECPAAGEVAVQTLAPGEVFGEMSFFHPSRHSATVRSVSPVRVLRLDHEAYDALQRRRSLAPYKLAHNVATILAARLRKTDHFAADMVHRCADAEDRLLWRSFRARLQFPHREEESPLALPAAACK